MITTTGRFPEEPLPRLDPAGAEAPEFPVRFSRRPEGAGRLDTWPNSFRWSGNGTIRLMERGLLVVAKRRLAIGFHATEHRFVPASEISDAYREGNSVRVDLRGEVRNRDFFQFWAADVATAGTIVRLLPTKRTIEYEEPPAPVAADRSMQPPDTRAPHAHTIVLIALVVAMIGTAGLVTAIKFRERAGEQSLPMQEAAAPTARAVPRSPSSSDILNARAVLIRYDDRIDGLRAEFRIALAALEHGDLSQGDFIDGVNRWLTPQWHTLYRELAMDTRNDESLDTAVRKRLMATALGWNAGLREYVHGLENRNYLTVLGALEQMSAGNEEQRRAWRLIPREER